MAEFQITASTVMMMESAVGQIDPTAEQQFIHRRVNNQMDVNKANAVLIEKDFEFNMSQLN